MYIARGNNERLLNEDKVIECLKNYGFEIIPQGSGNYEQTLDAFMTADNIFGMVGTNMVTQIISKPGANIYIISPFEFQADNAGFAVTDASGRSLHFISADIVKSEKMLNRSNFSVDIAKIEAVAKKINPPH